MHGIGGAYAIATPIGPAIFSIGRAFDTFDFVSGNKYIKNVR